MNSPPFGWAECLLCKHSKFYAKNELWNDTFRIAWLTCSPVVWRHHVRNSRTWLSREQSRALRTRPTPSHFIYIPRPLGINGNMFWLSTKGGSWPDLPLFQPGGDRAYTLKIGPPSFLLLYRARREDVSQEMEGNWATADLMAWPGHLALLSFSPFSARHPV